MSHDWDGFRGRAMQAAWLVETDPTGGYSIAAGNRDPGWTRAVCLPTVAA